VIDVVAEEIECWRNRPVDEVYPIVYVDGIRIKVRDQGAVTVKVAYLVIGIGIGIDIDGRKHALGGGLPRRKGPSFGCRSWPSCATGDYATS
jgi:putative transposase